MEVWRSGKDFRTMLEENPEVSRKISSATLDELFDVNKSIRNVDYIFQRVGLA